MNIDLGQVTEHAIECFGLTGWQGQKVGAIVLIFDLKGEKERRRGKGEASRRKQYNKMGKAEHKETRDMEEFTKDSENDDVDEGTVRKNVVPQFKAFRVPTGPGLSTHASPTFSRAPLKLGYELATERMLMCQPKRGLQLSPRLPFNSG